MEMDIRFLNIDLEVESSEDLQPLIDDLGEDVSVLYQGENGSGFNFVSFEVKPSGAKDVDGIVASFCLFIENLTPEARQIWDNCHTRKFDAGFQSGSSPRSYQSEIRADTIKRVSEIVASIVVTIYPQSH